MPATCIPGYRKGRTVPDQSIHSIPCHGHLVGPLCRLLTALHLRLRYQPDSGDYLGAVAGAATRSLLSTSSPGNCRRQRSAPYPHQAVAVPYYPGVRGTTTPGTASQYPNQAASYTEPSADNRAGNAPASQLNIRDQGPNDYQTEIVRPIPVTSGDANSPSPGSQPWTGGPAERLAQNPAGLEIIRPGIPAIQVPLSSGAGPASAVRAAGAQPSEAARAMQGIGVTVRPVSIPSADAGASAGTGHPRADGGDQARVWAIRRARDRPGEHDPGSRGPGQGDRLAREARRIYAPDENMAGIQIVTDKEIAVVGKKQGTTVLNLWFPDPRDPNNPQKDRTLSYMVVVLADPERAALEVLAERKRLEAQVKAFEQALKVLEREIKEAFPDSAVQLSLVGEQVVVRGECEGCRRGGADPPHRRRTYADKKANNGRLRRTST